MLRKIADSNSDLATLKPVILTFSDSLKLVYLPTKAIQVSGHAYVLGVLILPLFLLWSQINIILVFSDTIKLVYTRIKVKEVYGHVYVC